MSQTVDHYGSQYGRFVTDLYAAIREATYDQDIGQNGWLTAAEQDRFMQWLAIGTSHRLLDIACGSGGPTLRVAETTGCWVNGIDIHADGVATATAQAVERGLADRSAFHQADGSTTLPFETGSFDALMCIDAINHLPDRRAVLKEWHRVLKPGGRLVFTDPTVITGPVTHEEIAVRASIGFFLFVPDGADDHLLQEAGFVIEHREDRTDNMAAMAERWRQARAEHGRALREAEGDHNFDGQQEFFEVAARLAKERRLSRIAYGAIKS
ncbi:MAG: class I SAM-dependent methyltransferase [Planctomycetota bacterium]|jgi:SAM-dependent methyltransferase